MPKPNVSDGREAHTIAFKNAEQEARAVSRKTRNNARRIGSRALSDPWVRIDHPY
jgi:hypothetical protein